MTNKATVYFDGLCPLCSREIKGYRKMRGADAFKFVDITAPGFSAAEEGLDPKRVHEVFHVKDEAGKIHAGVPGFIEIWRRLDSLRWLVPLASVWPVRKLLELGYFLFAKVRPYLPRKGCEASPYCELPRKP